MTNQSDHLDAPSAIADRALNADMEPVPTIGRCVHYYHVPDRHDGRILPMTVTEVHSDTCVSGTVQDALNATGCFPVRSIEKGHAPGQWSWPPRV